MSKPSTQVTVKFHAKKSLEVDVSFLVADDGGVEAICTANVTQKTSGANPSVPHSALREDDFDTMEGVPQQSNTISAPQQARPMRPIAEIQQRSSVGLLNVWNVIDIVKFADDYVRSAESTKQACLKFIAREWDAVYESDKWKELEQEMPTLAADLAFGVATLIDAHTARFKRACLELITRVGKTVFKRAAWKKLRETKHQFALDLAEEASIVPVE